MSTSGGDGSRCVKFARVAWRLVSYACSLGSRRRRLAAHTAKRKSLSVRLVAYAFTVWGRRKRLVCLRARRYCSGIFGGTQNKSSHLHCAKVSAGLAVDGNALRESHVGRNEGEVRRRRSVDYVPVHQPRPGKASSRRRVRLRSPL